MNDRLYRSRSDRILGGVCAGVGERLEVDPSLIRVFWVIGTIFTGFVFGILLYVILLAVVPEAPEGWVPGPPPPYPPAPPRPDAVPGWTPPEPAPTWAPAAAAGPAASGADPGASGPPAIPPEGAAWVPPAGTTASAPSASGPVPGSDAWLAADAAYASRREERRARRGRNERSVALVFGALLILAGIWFLVREYIPELDFQGFWPLVIIVLGVLLLARAFTGSRDHGDGGGGTAA